MGWFEERFIEVSANRLRFDCLTCSRPMWLPPSKHGKYVTCGGPCATARYASITKPKPAKQPVPEPRSWECAHCAKVHIGGAASRKYCDRACSAAGRLAYPGLPRQRECGHCGKQFVVKKSQIDSGHGQWCSHRCAFLAKTHEHLISAENLAKAAAARAASVAVNGTRHKSGHENPSWKGGPEAARERGREKQVAYRRKYRARNPEKVREFAARRKSRKLGRLPRGTVNRIGTAQRWKCVICRASIKHNYHLDHIVPLARGGTHEASNVQLLCPDCNVRKSAKDPIDYMQSRGFLL